MTTKVISYYSPRYASYAAMLRESCARWGVDAEIASVKEFKTWWHGVAAKPKFILNQLELYSNGYDGVLWVDADAYFVRPVPWGELLGDIAATRFQWSSHHKLETLTGTIYFANNKLVKVFLSEWIKATERMTASDTPEQDSLTPLIHAWGHSLVFTPLSVEWTWINDERFEEMHPGKIPLIKHSQASRQIRAEEFRRAQAK